MNEECLICKAPLVYLTEEEIMECALCGIDMELTRYSKRMEQIPRVSRTRSSLAPSVPSKRRSSP